MPPEEPAYADDPAILDAESLLRRVPPWHYVKKNDTWIVSSAAFEDSDDRTPMSTARENRVVLENYLSPFPGFGVARLPVRAARSHGQLVTQIPPVADEPEHTWVAGKKTHSVRAKLRDDSPLIIEPEKR